MSNSSSGGFLGGWLGNAIQSVKNWFAPKTETKTEKKTEKIDKPNVDLFGLGSGSSTNIVNVTTPRAPAYTKGFESFYDENKARETAVGKYDPYYDELKKMESEKYSTNVRQIGESYDLNKSIIDNSLARYAEQAGLLTNRTKEDLDIEIGSILEQRGEQRATTAYDRIRQNRAVMAELASSGMQFGGMAAGVGRDMREKQTLDRNQANRIFEQAESSARLSSKRTLEDIDTGLKTKRAEAEEDIQKLGMKRDQLLENARSDYDYNVMVLNEQRKQAIEDSVYGQMQQAYNEWDADMKKHYAKYGVSF